MRSATEIVNVVGAAREDLWPLRMEEKDLYDFFNGGVIPTDGCEEYASLGTGHRFLKRPMQQLIETMYMRPGPVSSKIISGDPIRRPTIEQAIDMEINKRIVDRYTPIIYQAAGDAMICGRSFLYRTNAYDWVFRNGKLIHDYDAPADVDDDSFWWWAFLGELKLSEIDSRLEMSKRYKMDKGRGWDREGLKELKKHVLNKHINKGKNEGHPSYTRITDQMCEAPFPTELQDDYAKVIYYFEKEETRSENGEGRKVSFAIVSRFGDGSSIKKSSKENNGRIITSHSLHVSTNSELQSILFRMDASFDSVRESLVPIILDANISGEQKMSQVTGAGKQSLHRLLTIEHLQHSIVEGASFAIQPNFLAVGNGVDRTLLERLSKNGISSFDVLPPGLAGMEKSNLMGSFGQVLGLIQAFGLSVEQDAATGSVPVSFGKNVDFERKAVGEAFLSDLEESVSYRIATWRHSLDRLWRAVGNTLSRSEKSWSESDPAYYVARNLRKDLEKKYNIKPSEWTWKPDEEPKLMLESRRIAGGDTRRDAFRRAQTLLSIAPNQGLKDFATKMMLESLYGIEVVNQQMPDRPSERQLDQIESANVQTSAALNGFLMQPEPSDDFAIHVQLHGQTLQFQLQALGEQGFVSVPQRKGLQILMQHCALDASGLPDEVRDAVLLQLQQAAQQLASIPPMSTPADMDAQMKQRQLALKEEEIRIKQAAEQRQTANAQSLIENREKESRRKMAVSDSSDYRENRRLAGQEELSRIDAEAKLRKISLAEEQARLNTIKTIADEMKNEASIPVL